MEEIVFRHVSKKYANHVVLSDLNLVIEPNKITCILGKSGAGKTTFLHLLAQAEKYEGEIIGLPNRVSYLFQEPRLLPNRTVAQNIAYVLPKGRWGEIAALLDAVEIGAKKNCYPRNLSGGEAQRVAIARAFAVQTEMLLMDEPFQALDTGLKVRLIHLLVQLWKKEKKTVVFVTHDLEEAAMLAQRVLYLEDGAFTMDEKSFETIPRDYGADSLLKKKMVAKIIIKE